MHYQDLEYKVSCVIINVYTLLLDILLYRQISYFIVEYHYLSSNIVIYPTILKISLFLIKKIIIILFETMLKFYISFTVFLLPYGDNLIYCYRYIWKNAI